MTGDLVVLAADKDIEYALRGLLTRPQAIRIRPLGRTEFVTHPNHDPGLDKNGPELVQRFARDFEHALLVLDAAWSGAPQAARIEERLEQRLARAWGERGRAVCIVPEVEVWVWSDSPHVASQLGWASMDELRAWLDARQLWPKERPKPADPKSAMRAALRERRIPPSPAIFRLLGETVGVARCQDASFGRLLEILRAWFPAIAGNRSA